MDYFIYQIYNKVTSEGILKIKNDIIIAGILSGIRSEGLRESLV